ncbi:MAG: hypothetical protein QXY05_03785 [Candidatus Anstonellales archaeon]
MDANYILSLLFSSEFLYFLASTVTLAVYLYIIAFFYKRLSKRDVAVFNETGPGKGIGAFLKGLLSEFFFIIKNLVLTPVYVFLWSLLIAVMIVFLTREHDVGYAVLVSALLVSTTRMLAYVNEEIAAEVGKLIPIAFLAAVLLDPAILFSVPVNLEDAVLAVSGSVPKLAVFMIAVEVLLRFAYEIIKIIKFMLGVRG